jgi:hypothetical protein
MTPVALAGVAALAALALTSGCTSNDPREIPAANHQRSAAADSHRQPQPKSRASEPFTSPRGPAQDSRYVAPHVAALTELTAAERLYGIGPVPDPSVTYQPDVIFVARGADAVRGIGDDPLEWLLDAAAIRRDDVQPGTLLFVTGRVVGRVLRVRELDGTLAVMLGPFELTDLIREAHVSVDQPIDFAQAIAYRAPLLPGASSEVPPIAHRLQAPAFVWKNVVSVPAPATRLRGLQTAGPGLVGARALADGGGLKLLADAALHVATPRVRFNLEIQPPGKIKRAELVLSGAAGVLIGFEAGSETGTSANINERVEIPADISIPMIGGGLPLSVMVRQIMVVKTAFGGQGYLRARGNYAFGGSLGIGFVDGVFGVGSPNSFTTTESLVQSIDGSSLGVSGAVLTYQFKIIGGLGAGGFAVGPYVAFYTTAGVYRHADTDLLLRCKGATLVFDLTAGVGYAMPTAVADVVNFFLRAIKVRQIRADGGVQFSPRRVLEQRWVTPEVAGCQIP